MNTETMTAEELREFEEFKAMKAKKQAKEQRTADLEAYKEMIDQQIEATIPELYAISEQLAKLKEKVFGNFKALLAMKNDVLKMTKDGQRSHTFTNSECDKRIELGCYQIDNYDDTAQSGIDMIKSWIQSKAKDAEAQALVDMVMLLLAKDQKGTLKASRVLQLRNMAEKVNDERFTEGVEIIMNAYKPTPSKRFIRASVKDEDGEWISIPLSITDAN